MQTGLNTRSNKLTGSSNAELVKRHTLKESANTRVKSVRKLVILKKDAGKEKASKHPKLSRRKEMGRKKRKEKEPNSKRQE